MLNYTDITQNTFIQSWTITEIIAREKCGHLAFPRSVRLQLYREPPLSVVIWLRAQRTLASFTAPRAPPNAIRQYLIAARYANAWNPKDNRDMSASVFVVQFNGFMSLTSYFDVMYGY